MLDVFKRLLKAGVFTAKESFTLSSRPAKFGETPGFLAASGVADFLDGRLGRSGLKLWRHQSIALMKFGLGRNVVVATGTASGKSTIFRSAAFHTVRMDPKARVVVFYPLKALVADQLRGWQEMAEALDMPLDSIGRIDGSVDVRARDGILERSRIVIMTPDVCHAWMMARLSVPSVRAFVGAISLVVLDEAHTMEGVFGSNFAFLIRRLLLARSIAGGEPARANPPRFIAATATIANPADQVGALTGFSCDVIGEEDDGSAQSERLCVHIVAPDGEELTVAQALQVELLKGSSGGAFITFVDSRKGVEVLARASSTALKNQFGEGSVMPYRAGFDARDRENIEVQLRSGKLRGVVSTSALELGIDLPSLTVGMNVGVPASRKAYRQRLGRIGRAGDGAFLVIAGSTAFTGFGTSFRQYHELSVEDSYLYLDNRFMQFAHARCLVDELDALGVPATLPGGIQLPQGFCEVFAMAKPGGSRPPEFDAIAQLGGDTPQRSYPLRNVGEVSFRIALGDGSESIGEVNQLQALRECYPGASYLHLGRTYEVITWNTGSFTPPFVKVKPGSPKRSTSPRISTWINAGLTTADVIERHYLSGPGGFLAECQMQITEKVEGYTEHPPGQYRSYRDLRQKNPNLKSRQRNFRTSGVLVAVNEDWFRAKGLKEQLAERIASVFARENSISMQDIGYAATNISVRTADGGGPRSDCIAVFDQTYGSLRLTERLFLGFSKILDRLQSGLAAERVDAVLLASADAFRAWHSSMEDKSSELSQGPEQVREFSRVIQVFSHGSQVCCRDKGQMASEVEIVGVTMMDDRLMYQVKAAPRYPADPPVKRWVAASSVEPSAASTEWEYVAWDTELQEFVSNDVDEP